MQATLFAAALALALAPRGAQAAATRGVAPGPVRERYPAGADVDWACLSQPEKKIPAANINDDFCDCADGSDEPGTAACSHFPGTTFWCENAKYKGNSIYSSRVNDGARPLFPPWLSCPTISPIPMPAAPRRSLMPAPCACTTHVAVLQGFATAATDRTSAAHRPRNSPPWPTLAHPITSSPLTLGHHRNTTHTCR